MRRENKNICTLREFKILGKGLRIKIHTVVGGESHITWNFLVSHCKSIIQFYVHILLAEPLFWRTVKKEILCMNRVRSFLRVSDRFFGIRDFPYLLGIGDFKAKSDKIRDGKYA